MRILHNARIFSRNSSYQPSAIFIENGRIKHLGSDPEILSLADKNVVVENMQGRTIWPGLVDSHIHLEHYALGLRKIDCETKTKEECLARVANRAIKEKKDAWILGHGWNHNEWDGVYGTANELDQVSFSHPVFLTAKSLHAGWANTAALKEAGISSTTHDPEGGVIQRDERGNPTGILMESATKLVEKTIPQPGHAEIAEALQQAQTELWKLGLTGVHDFDRSNCFFALQMLQLNNHLKLRVTKSIPLEGMDEAINLGLTSGFGNDYLRMGSIKLFADGALGPQTAAMLSSYENSSSDCGILLLDRDAMVEFGRKAVQNRLSLAVHAIGDRANHTILNAFQEIRRFEKNNGKALLRHRIEHVQILDPSDIDRLSKFEIIASMQPIHATSDMFMADKYWGSRAQYSYAWKSLLNAGSIISFGSDAPVESPNPFLGLHAAVTRRRVDGAPGIDGWFPDQKISLQDAVNSYTIHPAYAAGSENIQAQLLPGFFADMIVLPVDPFQVPEHDIQYIQPISTMIAGEWVWTHSA